MLVVDLIRCVATLEAVHEAVTNVTSCQWSGLYCSCPDLSSELHKTGSHKPDTGNLVQACFSRDIQS